MSPAILQVFADANERLEDRAGAGRDPGPGGTCRRWYKALSGDDFHAALGQLKDWRLLDMTQNHAENYRTAHFEEQVTESLLADLADDRSA